jgi:DedD protein
VLESRHLVGLFLGVVLLCGVFFTLGYVMGRNQFGGPVHAEDTRIRETPSPKPSAAKSKQSEPAPSNSGDWDFYGKSSAKNPDAAEAPAAASRDGGTSATSGPKTKPVASTTPPTRFQPPKMGKSAIVLQVSALTRQSDALAMADAIQQKGFPSFVLTPTTDNFYRVQVGPYADEKSADASKRALEQAGFKSIIKR